MLKTKSNLKNSSMESNNSVSSYLKDISRYPLLKHEDSIELFQRYENGREKTNTGETVLVTQEAKKAKKKIIESNLRLVVSIAKAYKNSGLSFEDLVQEGNLGLIKSIDKYDWKKGFRFSTYASWWVKQAIGQHVMKRKRTIRMPAHAQGVQKKLSSIAEEYKKHFNSEPTIEELSELTGASEKIVRATLESNKRITSLSDPIGSSDDKMTIGDTLQDESEGSDPFGSFIKKELTFIMKDVLNELSPKESAILRLRFGLVEDPANSDDFPITEEELEGVILRGEPLK